MIQLQVINMFLLKLAALNVRRNVRRSLITIFAIGIGLAALIFLWGFSDGSTEQTKQNITKLFTGHVQIHVPGFEKKLSVDLIIPDREMVLNEIQSNSNVAAFSERVKCNALIGNSNNSNGVLLIGIDPVKEVSVTNLQDHMIKGQYLDSKDKKGLILGDLLAKKLELDVGDKAVVMTQSFDGTLAGYAYHVRGIFHTGGRMNDENCSYINLASGQNLLDIDKQSHEIVILLKDREAIPSFISSMKNSLNPSAYEIRSWDEILPEPMMWIQWYQFIMRTIFLTIMIVISVGIMNTVLMSVFERTKEFGVMMAIGTSPQQIIKLILLETLLLEFCGVVFGTVLGYLIVFYFGKYGIAFKQLEAALSQSYMGTVVYTSVEPVHVLESIISLVLITSVISLYPAWRAGHMEPVKAIYHS